MAAHFLEAEHNLGQPIESDLSPLAQVADVVILAEKAEKIAVGEENSPRSFGPDQRVFLSEMRAVAGDNGHGARAAIAFFIGSAIYLALPQTKAAVFKDRLSPGRSICERAFLV
jgi:hypothetical protein